MGPDLKVEIQLQDFAIATTLLDECHEELCYLYLDTKDPLLEPRLRDLYTIRYMLS